MKYIEYIMDSEYEDLKNTTWQVHGTMNIYLPTYLPIYLSFLNGIYRIYYGYYGKSME